MRLLLLAVVLVHGLQAQEKGPTPSPGPSHGRQLSGTWYTSSLASNNSALIAPGGPFRVFVNSMDVNDSNLTGHILVPTGSRCYRSSLVALKTDAEWFYLEFWGRNKLYVADVVADKFSVLYMINEQEGVTSLVAGLFARSPVAEQESLDRFESICEDLGLGKEQIVFLEDTDRCQEFRA
uniref:Lipocalin/cytosolic fatty-acid binding domain-containing protein n=1 Tax=Prolemur simus TaxID=1328070 RepID=A0A8C8Z993_PROSS